MKKGMNLSLRRSRHSRQNLAIRGVTLIEALVTIAVIGILGSVAAANVTKVGAKPLSDNVNKVAGLFRSARSKAIAQTLPIKIKPTGRLAVPSGTSTGGNNNQLEAWKPDPTQSVSTYNLSCNSETGWVLDNALTQQYASGTYPKLTLPDGITLQSTQVDTTVLSTPTAWEICFNTRGIASVTSVSSASFNGNDVTLTFQDASNSTTQRLEVFPAGGIQIYAN
jgi:prepilin-type N-terminal cleavage/methylation domain-containing protein